MVAGRIQSLVRGGRNAILDLAGLKAEWIPRSTGVLPVGGAIPPDSVTATPVAGSGTLVVVEWVVEVLDLSLTTEWSVIVRPLGSLRVVGARVVLVNDLDVQIGGLLPSTAYTVEVRGLSFLGDPSVSAPVSVDFITNAGPTPVPVAGGAVSPTVFNVNLAADNPSASIEMSWEVPPDLEQTNAWSILVKDGISVVETRTFLASFRAARIDNLTPETQYDVEIRGLSYIGDPPVSDSLSETITTSVNMGAVRPDSVIAVPTPLDRARSVDVTWTVPSDLAQTLEWNVVIRANGSIRVISTRNVLVDTLGVTIGGLEPNTDYDVEVRGQSVIGIPIISSPRLTTVTTDTSIDPADEGAVEPEDLVVENVDNFAGAIDVSWTVPADPEFTTWWGILVKEGNRVHQTRTVPVADTDIRIIGLPYSTTLTVEVRGLSVGTPPTSDPVSANITIPTPSGAVRPLVVTLTNLTTTYSTIRASWTVPTDLGATDFWSILVFKGNSIITTRTIPADMTVVEIDNLPPETDIIVQVRGVSNLGLPTVSLSRNQLITTLAILPPGVPLLPMAVVETVGGIDYVKFTWLAPSFNNVGIITGYEIQRQIDVAGQVFETLGSTNDLLSFFDFTIERNNTYRYRVRATGPGGPSVVWATTGDVIVPQFDSPGPPSDVVASVGYLDGYWVYLSWTAPSSGGPLIGYEIERITSTGMTASPPLSIGTSFLPLFADTGVVGGFSYSYRVRTFGPDGISSSWSAYSNVVSISTDPPDPPGGDFNTLSAAGNDGPFGIWSNGSTMWVTNNSPLKIYAYDVTTKAHTPSQDFDTLIAASNVSPAGLWSDGITMWVADRVSLKLYAYDLITKARTPDQDFDTLIDAGIINPAGLWSDGSTMWVMAQSIEEIYAFDLITKVRIPDQDFDMLETDNYHPLGIWSDGSTMWVSSHADDKIYAYDMVTKVYTPSEDFDTLEAAGNQQPFGLWSNGITMWVVDNIDNKLYAYDLATKARTP